MFIDDKMDVSDCLWVLEVLYGGLCFYIGILMEVIIRRELMDMEEIIWNLIGINKGIICMYSGSYREGFRLKFLD